MLLKPYCCIYYHWRIETFCVLIFRNNFFPDLLSIIVIWYFNFTVSYIIVVQVCSIRYFWLVSNWLVCLSQLFTGLNPIWTLVLMKLNTNYKEFFRILSITGKWSGLLRRIAWFSIYYRTSVWRWFIFCLNSRGKIGNRFKLWWIT